ncbi:MAG: MotA/TolQ/ExbB proton channel family protein [Bacteroidales bacterium]|jgi:biopolymer transport protein ExbB|nr:MotA/TolQ/ExbB proton channel family protein [Bacteroidales bacterium]
MKKLFALIAVIGMFTLSASNVAFAQTDDANVTNEEVAQTESNDSTVVEKAETTPTEVPASEDNAADEPAAGEQSFHKQVKKLFIDGGPEFMTFVLLALILGLAIAIERILYLNFATTNTTKLLNKVEAALNEGGIEAAKEVCRNTRGPVASIFYQSLMKYDEGIDVVEKSIIAYGSVQTGLLEKNLSWVSLFISLAPMLGFMGTVIGMIKAFADIEAAGDISASLVAAGIKVALITTVSGLVVAMILQVFYNYLVSKIDGLVNTMEDASISMIDILVKYNLKK